VANLLFIEGLEIDFYNGRSLVLFICILQGAIFSLLLFWRSRKKKTWADFWLGLLLVFLCASLITPFIGFANVYDRNQWLTYFPFGNPYIYGSFVYFYVLSLTDAKRRFARRDLLFFAPAAVYLVFRLVLFAQSIEFKGWFDKNYYAPVASPIIFVSSFAWNTIFLSFALKHYRKYRVWLDENFSDTEKIKFDWLRNFLYVFTVVFVLGGVFDFTDSFIFSLSYIQYFYFELVLALVTYYLAIAGYLRSATIELNFAPSSESPETEPRNVKSLLSDDELKSYKIRLQNLMTREKPFLNPQLALADLSKQFGVNTTVLSHVINQGFGKNFNDFINEYRVREIIGKLQNGNSAKDAPLLAIAFDCGFNSKATFNRAFKKIIGASPKEFQDNNLKLPINANENRLDQK
jgi:AraC-like DNA-binding protein